MVISRGPRLYGVFNGLPKLEQITVGGRCLATASVLVASRFFCRECRKALTMQVYFSYLLTNIKVCSFSSSFSQATSVADGFAGSQTLGSSPEKWHTAGG